MTQKQVVLLETQLSGKSIKESAAIAGLSYSYAKRLCAGLDTNGNFKAELVKREAEIRQRLRIKTEITRAELIEKFEAIHDEGIATGKLQAANKALENIGRMIGAYGTDNKQKGLGSLGSAIADMVKTRQALEAAEQRSLPEARQVLSTAADTAKAAPRDALTAYPEKEQQEVGQRSGQTSAESQELIPAVLGERGRR